MRGRPPRLDRGQAYTLEGLVASVAVLTAVLYGLQVVDLGPWTSEATAETTELETQAEDVLDMAAEEGSLSRVVRCYPVGKDSFGGGDPGNLSRRTYLERLLNQTFDEQDRDYNVYVAYWTDDGRERVTVSTNRSDAGSGFVSPSDAAAVASRTVTVYDTEPLLANRSGRDCDGRAAPPGSGSIADYNDVPGQQFYMEETAPDSTLYTVAEVRLVVW